MTFRLPAPFFTSLRHSLVNAFRYVPALLLIMLLPSAMHAQAVAYNGTVKTLGIGFHSPIGVALDGAGNVFVTDAGNNTVQEILAAGGYTTVNAVASAYTAGGGFYIPEGVVVDGAGNVFVANSGRDIVVEILAAGGYTTVNTIGSIFNAPSGIALDKNNNLFVSDAGTDSVKEILVAGGYKTVITLATGLSGPAGLAVDSNENIFLADYHSNTVKEILAAGGYTTINTLGSGFFQPFGVALDANGNVFIGDQVNNAVKEILAASGYTIVKTVGSGFSQPVGVALDKAGNIFVADEGNQAVKEISLAGGNFGSVNVGSTSSSSLSLSFIFNSNTTLGSTAVLMQGTPNLDFTDAGSNTCTANTAYTTGETCLVNVNFTPTHPGARYGAVELLDGSGNLLALGYVQGTGVGPQVTFANTTSGNYAPSSQITLGSGFSHPFGLAEDGAGNIFIADTYNNVVKEIIALGGYTTVNTLGSGLLNPTDVAVDGGGNIFVADAGNNAVKEILSAGGYTTVSTLGSGFSYPYGVAVDGDGNIFVADVGNDAVKEILALGGYTTVNTLGYGFSEPTGVAVDRVGNVFVADYNNSAVKEILAAGGYTTVNTLGYGFNQPSGVAVDATGNVFVADSINHAAKEILAAGGYTIVNTLKNGFAYPRGITVDSGGNVFVADPNNNQIIKLDYTTPPSITFTSTLIGSTSSDSPQTVILSNDGNAALTLTVPSSGTNPSISTNFGLGISATCPSISTLGTAQTLAMGASCTLPLSFTPTVAGLLSGQLMLTDNTLNAVGPSYATQIIPLNGIGSGTGPTSIAVVSGLNQKAPFSTYLPNPLVVVVKNSSGNGVPNITVTFAAGSGINLSATSVTTDSSGQASITAEPTASGIFTVTASVIGVITPAVFNEMGFESIIWSTPKTVTITYGTNLSSVLTATANVPGIFAYTAAAGAPVTASTVLPAGVTQLGVWFTPENGTPPLHSGVRVRVLPAPLTVTAQSMSVTYGSQVPKYTYNITGYVNGDSFSAISGIPTINATAASRALPAHQGVILSAPVGTYVIHPTWGSLQSSNYTFSFVPATLTITPAKTPLTITAYSETVANAAYIPTVFSYKVTGMLGFDLRTTAGTGTPSVITTATSNSPAGNYPISISAGTYSAPNYSGVNYVNGTLTMK